ncbi:unnamed protein product [Blepharisma stoltei]|uniref:Uncharacterized protein n=1 Tax=Blepharisma stoltei TaxID=1481888 RepID=A0AAU9JC45_9CILI|nr:unnamed protein product [Blepharisma stoltei]
MSSFLYNNYLMILDRQHLRFLALTICIFLIIRGISIQNFKFFLYLTHWALIVKTLTFLCIFRGLGSDNFRKNLLVIAWTSGINVTIIYWTYAYPLMVSPDFELWHLLLTHGGICLFLIPEIMTCPFTLSNKDFLGPACVAIIYISCVLIPCAYFGMILYPGLTFTNFLSFIVVLANLLVSFGAFSIGKYVSWRFKIRPIELKKVE